MRDALLYILSYCKMKQDTHGYRRDAKLIEKTMAGFGTQDKKLVYRYADLLPLRTNADATAPGLSARIGTLHTYRASRTRTRTASRRRWRAE